ncbi:MAG: hypothetical protein ACQR33_04260 [Candidatus Saccharibacteria bacterium]
MPHLTSDERHAVQAESVAVSSNKSFMLGMTLLIFVESWFAAHYLFLIIGIPLILTGNVEHVGHMTNTGAIIGTIGTVMAVVFRRRDSILPFLTLLVSSILLAGWLAFTMLF